MRCRSLIRHLSYYRCDKLNDKFIAWSRELGVGVGGLFLACLVVEMKNAKQYDKDLYVVVFFCCLSQHALLLTATCRMKLPGEQLLYMQYQAKALAKLGASPANKLTSRLPFCPGVHIDGRSFRFTFMSTELMDNNWRQWFVLPKVCWHEPNSVIRVASAVTVLIVRFLLSFVHTYMTSHMSPGCV